MRPPHRDLLQFLFTTNSCGAACDKHSKWCVAFDVDRSTGLCHLGKYRIGQEKQHAGESRGHRQARGSWSYVASDFSQEYHELADPVVNVVSNSYDDVSSFIHKEDQTTGPAATNEIDPWSIGT